MYTRLQQRSKRLTLALQVIVLTARELALHSCQFQVDVTGLAHDSQNQPQELAL